MRESTIEQGRRVIDLSLSPDVSGDPETLLQGWRVGLRGGSPTTGTLPRILCLARSPSHIETVCPLA